MSRVIFKITDENFYECIDVIKQIFWMYHDIMLNGGIVHNINYGKVDYKKYIMCEIVEERLKTSHEIELVKLVNQGCFTALCCHVSDLLDEGLLNITDKEFVFSILQDKRINDNIFGKDLLIVMHNILNLELSYKDFVHKEWPEYLEGKAFDEKRHEVYTKYVCTYYKSMLEGNSY